MTIGVLLLGISAGIDVFAGGLAYGVAGLPRKRWMRTAAAFSGIGVALLAAGLLFGEALENAVGNAASYLAGFGLLAIGLKGIWDVVTGEQAAEIEALDDPSAAQRPLALTAVMVSLDKVAIGISLAVADLSLGRVLGSVAILCFVATLAGLSIGRRLGSRLGAAAHGLAGGVFVLLGAVIIYKALTGTDVY
jgi:putative Mn2+ efflux pump MntP